MGQNHEKEIVRAGQAVYRAVRAGKLSPVRTLLCAKCGNPAKEYHHHNGYGREHWLDVVPLCIPCHVRADRRGGRKKKTT